MLISLFAFSICISVVCDSVALPMFEFPDYQQGLLNGFDFSFGMLKQDYLTRVSKLKEDVINCPLSGSCLNFTDKIKILNKIFRHDAEKMKHLQKQSMQMFHRRNYIRCLNCIVDYINQMIDEFCDTMDDMQDEFDFLDQNGNSSTIPTVDVTDQSQPQLQPQPQTQPILPSSLNGRLNVAIPTNNITL